MALAGRRRRRITAEDLAGYGSVADGEVNVERAAAGLGVSKTQVRQAIKQVAGALRKTFYRRLSGRGDAEVVEGVSVRGMLQAAYGRGPRGGAVNARAAAQHLGVSVGTVRRWAAGTQKPSPAHLAALQSAARRAITTKRGRRAATADFRASAAGRQALRVGSKLWVSGEQGVGGYDQGYARDRRVAVDISPDEVEAMLRAYEQGAERGLREWLTKFFDDKYVAGWGFVTIDDFGIGTPQ